MENSIIYIRQLRKVDYSVFAVADGLKQYWDNQFGKKQPMASGQQVKRCIMETLVTQLNTGLAPVEFRWKLDKKTGKTKEDIAVQALSPTYPDLLFGGWMRASNEGKEEKNEGVIKRRSPLSISAFRPLHPLLGNSTKPETGTFDRRGNSNSTVSLSDDKGVPLSIEEMNKFLLETERGITKSKYLASLGERANGLYISDIAIDLRRLFTVSAELTDPEIGKSVRAEVEAAGWQKGKNAFGECYICPTETREKWAKALAKALLHWEFNSNQSRTYHPTEVIAVAISDTPYGIVNSIRAELDEEAVENPKAKPRMEEIEGTKLYKTPIISGVIAGEKGSGNSLIEAEKLLVERFLSFQY